jgi:hypothetical protein
VTVEDVVGVAEDAVCGVCVVVVVGESPLCCLLISHGFGGETVAILYYTLQIFLKNYMYRKKSANII